MTKKDAHPILSKFESIDWLTGKPPSIVEKMTRAEELKKEARAALFSTNNRSTAATGTPLFTTGSQSSFFKTLNIPSTFKVKVCMKTYNIHNHLLKHYIHRAPCRRKCRMMIMNL